MLTIENIHQRPIIKSEKHHKIEKDTIKELWKELWEDWLYNRTWDNKEFEEIIRKFNAFDKFPPATSQKKKLDFLRGIWIKESVNPNDRIEEQIPLRTKRQIRKAKRLIEIPTFIHRGNSKEMDYRNESLIDQLKTLEQNWIKGTLTINWSYFHTLYEREEIRKWTKKRNTWWIYERI